MKNALHGRPQENKSSFIPKIRVKDLLAKDLDDLIIERPCLEKGNITKALAGKHLETII